MCRLFQGFVVSAKYGHGAHSWAEILCWGHRHSIHGNYFPFNSEDWFTVSVIEICILSENQCQNVQSSDSCLHFMIRILLSQEHQSHGINVFVVSTSIFLVLRSGIQPFQVNVKRAIYHIGTQGPIHCGGSWENLVCQTWLDNCELPRWYGKYSSPCDGTWNASSVIFGTVSMVTYTVTHFEATILRTLFSVYMEL